MDIVVLLFIVNNSLGQNNLQFNVKSEYLRTLFVSRCILYSMHLLFLPEPARKANVRFFQSVFFGERNLTFIPSIQFFLSGKFCAYLYFCILFSLSSYYSNRKQKSIYTYIFFVISFDREKKIKVCAKSAKCGGSEIPTPCRWERNTECVEHIFSILFSLCFILWRKEEKVEALFSFLFLSFWDKSKVRKRQKEREKRANVLWLILLHYRYGSWTLLGYVETLNSFYMMHNKSIRCFVNNTKKRLRFFFPRPYYITSFPFVSPNLSPASFHCLNIDNNRPALR